MAEYAVESNERVLPAKRVISLADKFADLILVAPPELISKYPVLILLDNEGVSVDGKNSL
ncbi:hypothetical protein [Pectobacterium versatile]|uniref:hypothetical protein n=1 Tax=Pectobacterium versatile TaxID=2488639 RepID=UPI000D1B6068|nr:hypothetical protein [Pectobacterium versatile]